MKYDVGQYRHRITWQSPPVYRDTMNEPTGDWVTLGTFYARVEPLGGRELFNARQLKATSTHQINIRGGPDVLPSHRFLFQGTGRIFSLDSVNRIGERTEEVEAMATEQQNPQ